MVYHYCSSLFVQRVTYSTSHVAARIICSPSIQNWLDARERLGDDPMTDFNGMPYLVPVGMVSTQVRESVKLKRRKPL